MSASEDMNAPENFSELEVQDWFKDEDEPGEEVIVQPPTPDNLAEKYSASQLRVIRETKDYTLDYLQHALKKIATSLMLLPTTNGDSAGHLKKISTDRIVSNEHSCSSGVSV